MNKNMNMNDDQAPWHKQVLSALVMKVMPPHLWRFCAKIKTHIDFHYQSQWEWDVQYQYICLVEVSHTVVLWKWHASRNHLPYPVSIPHPGSMLGYNSHRASEVSCGKCNGFITSLATYSLGQMSEDEDMQQSVFLSLKCWMCSLFLKQTAFIWDLWVRHNHNTQENWMMNLKRCHLRSLTLWTFAFVMY